MEKREIENNLYFVSDSYLVAYLLTDGLEVESVKIFEKEDGRKTVDFYFKKTQELFATIKDFRSNEFLIKYNSNIKKVRKNVYQALRGEDID